MVGATMAEGELVGAQARREREQLMAEADAEHGHAAEQVADRGGLGDERLRIARAVREHDAVEGDERLGVDVVREDGDRGAGSGELAQDRALGPVVDDRDADIALGEHVRRLGRDAAGERLPGHRRLVANQLERLVHPAPVDGKRGAKGAVLPQVQGQRARIDAAQRRDVVLGEPIRPLGAAGLPHDDAARVRRARTRPGAPRPRSSRPSEP